MPSGLLRAYQTMLPRLRAQESLLATTRAHVAGAREYPEDSAKQIVREWQLVADGPQATQAPRRRVIMRGLPPDGLGLRAVPVQRPEASGG